MRQKIADYKQYEKDTDSKGVLNVDNVSLGAYKKQREKLKGFFDAQNEIGVIKKDIDEIKSLLHQLINNK
jgi:uncharacterized protein YutD